MRLMTHADTPERRQQVIAELSRDERSVLSEYRRVERNGASATELQRLAAEWRALRKQLEDLEKSEAIRALAGDDVPERCWQCHRRFDRHVTLCRVSIPAGLAACADCAPLLDLVTRHLRQHHAEAA